ncbi:MAG TPA: TfuA-like protein, partial [Opitutaceae bacterium]
MKVVFVGPSLTDPKLRTDSGSVRFRPPAAMGDVTKAVIEGATAVGLVDGVFEAVASVWHKEILYALAEGVQVFGAASMGALRAAECAPYGMIGVGAIFA